MTFLPPGSPVYVLSQNRRKNIMVGRIRGNIYYTARGHYQFFRKFNGFGLGAIVLRQLLARKVEHVVFRFSQHDITIDFSMGLDKFIAEAERWTDTSPNSIVGEEQLVCDVVHMNRYDISENMRVYNEI